MTPSIEAAKAAVKQAEKQYYRAVAAPDKSRRLYTVDDVGLPAPVPFLDEPTAAVVLIGLPPGCPFSDESEAAA